MRSVLFSLDGSGARRPHFCHMNGSKRIACMTITEVTQLDCTSVYITAILGTSLINGRLRSRFGRFAPFGFPMLLSARDRTIPDPEDTHMSDLHPARKGTNTSDLHLDG